MKKCKLKTLVKVILVLVVVGGIFKAYANFYEKELNSCIEAGHTEKYCKGIM